MGFGILLRFPEQVGVDDVDLELHASAVEVRTDQRLYCVDSPFGPRQLGVET